MEVVFWEERMLRRANVVVVRRVNIVIDLGEW
jgi:hypothetical protein